MKKSKGSKPKRKPKNPATSQSSPPAPPLLKIDLGPAFYEQIKQNYLKQIHPMVRGFAEDFFNWLKKITPQGIIDAIENWKTLQHYYKTSGFGFARLALAMVRGYFKIYPKQREEFDKILNPDLVMLILKFENPEVYNVIMRHYPEKGKEYFKACLEDLRKLLGIKRPKAS